MPRVRRLAGLPKPGNAVAISYRATGPDNAKNSDLLPSFGCGSDVRGACHRIHPKHSTSKRRGAVSERFALDRRSVGTLRRVSLSGGACTQHYAEQLIAPAVVNNASGFRAVDPRSIGGMHVG
jgi:hypothetical protein